MAKGGDAELQPGTPSALKYTVLGLLALALGWSTYNYSYILKVAHVHVSLATHHKATAFCAFTGCKYTEDMQELPGSSATQEQVAAPEVDEHLQETTRILSSRVCGSPAVDGYAHVVPKCLKESPTNKWYQAYYAAGGKQADLVVHIEPASDYDGLAVFWGIKNTKTTPEECAEHCKRHMPGQVQGPYSDLPCNAFAYCPDEVCFEPDAHHHTKGDCWLKFTEGPVAPEVNMRGDLPADYRRRHPQAPLRTQWVSGVLLPPGVKLTNGTWSPRWKW